LIWIKESRVAVVTLRSDTRGPYLDHRTDPLALEARDHRTKHACGFDPWIFSGGLGYRFNLFGPRIPEPAPIALK
jgi:hypothetical protein